MVFSILLRGFYGNSCGHSGLPTISETFLLPSRSLLPSVSPTTPGPQVTQIPVVGSRRARGTTGGHSTDHTVLPGPPRQSPSLLMVMIPSGKPRRHEGQLPVNLGWTSRRNSVKLRRSKTEPSCVTVQLQLVCKLPAGVILPGDDLKRLRPQIFDDKQEWLLR